jgi:hypothetical protein
MASVKEHLAAMHKSMSTTHAGEAQTWSKLEDCFGSMGKAKDDPFGEMFSKIASACGGMSKIHGAAADFHSQCADDCEKAEASLDIQKTIDALVDAKLSKTLVPDKLSSVAKVDGEAFGIRAVPRNGAPPAASEIEIDKAKERLAPIFHKLLAPMEG